jgi:hypothetical protein
MRHMPSLTTLGLCVLSLQAHADDDLLIPDLGPLVTTAYLSPPTTDEHYFGCQLSGAGDVNGDGYDDAMVVSDASSVRVYLGSEQGLTSTDRDDLALPQQERKDCRFIVSPAGDVNGDGYDDVMITYTSPTLTSYVRVVLGSADGIDPDTTLTIRPSNPTAYDRFGLALSGAGDVNGDGYDDIIIGAPVASNPSQGDGAAYIYLGSEDGIDTTTERKLSVPPTRNRLPRYLGSSVSGAGDVNDDGYDDVIVGSGQGGMAYVFHGGEHGISASTPETIAIRSSGNAYTSAYVAGLGDTDGDGYDDVGVALNDPYSQSRASASVAFVYPGSAAGITSTRTDISPTDAGLEGRFVLRPSAAGDTNGDGFADVALGVSYYYALSPNAVATVRLLSGSAFGVDPTTAFSLATHDAALHSLQSITVATAGDLNNDGLDDLILGSFIASAAPEGKPYDPLAFPGSVTIEYGSWSPPLFVPEGGTADDPVVW